MGVGKERLRHVPVGDRSVLATATGPSRYRNRGGGEKLERMVSHGGLDGWTSSTGCSRRFLFPGVATPGIEVVALHETL